MSSFTGTTPTWSLVKTLNVKIWASGASPGHSLLLEAITPATNVPWPSLSSSVSSLVQLERALCVTGGCVAGGWVGGWVGVGRRR